MCSEIFYGIFFSCMIQYSLHYLMVYMISLIYRKPSYTIIITKQYWGLMEGYFSLILTQFPSFFIFSWLLLCPLLVLFKHFLSYPFLLNLTFYPSPLRFLLNFHVHKHSWIPPPLPLLSLLPQLLLLSLGHQTHTPRPSWSS